MFRMILLWGLFAFPAFASEILSPCTNSTVTHAYRNYAAGITAVMYQQLGDRNAAEEIVQEAFLRLGVQLSGGEKILNVRAWLYRIAQNLLRDRTKSAFYRNGTYGDDPPELASRESDPAELAERGEQKQKLAEAFAKLSDGDREVLDLIYYRSLTTEEISERLGVLPTAIHMRSLRARERLRQLLVTFHPEYFADQY